MCESHPGGTGFEGMKGSWGAAVACHCVAELEPLKRAQVRLLIKVQPSYSKRSQHFRDTSTMGQLPRTAPVVEWSQPELRRQSVCGAQVRAREVTQALWRSHEDCERTPDIGH